MRERVVVFARVPVPGAVKTRLAPVLGAATAARLHAAFVRDIVSGLGNVPGRDIVLYHHPARPGDAFSALGVPLRPQVGADLGARMAHALRAEQALGAERVVLIGSDSPDLPPSRIDQAFAALGEADLVLGPALDGGYYLIGARGRPDPELFVDMPWGEPGLLAATVAVLRRRGIPFARLEPWYDVDRPADLEFLRCHLELLRLTGGAPRCAATRALLDGPGLGLSP